MAIRVANAADIVAIVTCEDLAFKFFAPGASKRDVSPDGELARQVRAGNIHVISEGVRVLGYICVLQQFDHLFVSAIAVLPSHHRRGLGGQLLWFAEREASRLGLGNVSLFTDGNIEGNLIFYRRSGYRETARCVEKHFSRVFFSKAIPPRVVRLDSMSQTQRG